MTESVHIVCPSCHAINRLPKGKLHDQPNCGKCSAPLFPGKPLDLTSATFEKQITKNDIGILVDFWAPWCGPCKAMAPAFAQAASQLEPNVRLAKVNTEVEQTLAAQFDIRSIPTMMLFRAGREVARQSGAMSAADIVRWVRSQ